MTTCLTPGCRRRVVPGWTLCDQCFDTLIAEVFGPKAEPGRTDFFAAPMTKAMRRVVRHGTIDLSRKETPRG